ncbi:CAAX prenyl protease 1 [Globomyces sp. JEL0801]|nr:CAAX prenyl protease 1 [Globomyces sp. JEL0801]
MDVVQDLLTNAQLNWKLFLNALDQNPYAQQVTVYVQLVEQALKDYDWDGVPWKTYAIYFMMIVYVWETYLDIRQHLRLKLKTLPKALNGIIEKATFEKSSAYGLDKSSFHFVSAFINQVQGIAILHYDFFPLVWNYSNQLLVDFGYIFQSILFSSILIVFFTVIGIPISLYQNFVIEARHGFNKQTYGLFFSDTIKSLLLTLGIGMPVLGLALYIIDWAGDNFYFYVWLFLVTFQIFFMAIFPTFIQPLFNKYTALEEGSLKKKIDALAGKLKFPLTKVYVVDGSKRSGHSNAYFYGFFGNKRIVIFDTLLKQCNEEEVIAVLAHELGHWNYNHVFKRLVIAQLHIFVLFYMFSRFVNLLSIYQSFGFESKSVLIGFLLFQYIYAPVESVIGFIMNIVSRSDEFQADSFAQNFGLEKNLKTGLIKIQTENLGNMNPDPLYSVWHHSHPPLIQRLAALDSKKRK